MWNSILKMVVPYVADWLAGVLWDAYKSWRYEQEKESARNEAEENRKQLEDAETPEERDNATRDIVDSYD